MFTIGTNEVLGLVKGWPIYLVVTPHHIGIYDDIIVLLNDTIGQEMHYSTKKNLKECKSSAISYYKYFWPHDKINSSINITEKNKLINI